MDNLSANIFQLLINNQECIYIGYTLQDIDKALTLLRYASNNKNLRRNKLRRPLLASITDWTNISIHLINKVKYTTKAHLIKICGEIKHQYKPTMNKKRSCKKIITDRTKYYKKKHTHTTASHTQEQRADYIERRRRELSICSSPFK